jgi:ribonuclease BN (tRNA processing enzyme)
VLAAALTSAPAPAAAQADCSTAALAVQVLGSGGPSAGGTRASAGYLVWRAGRAVVMVDAGGGTFLRFGEAGARLDDLSLLAISHLHPDHVADLPALLWLSEMGRRSPLRIAGPSGGGAFPPFDAFLTRLFDSAAGAFPILSGTQGQGGQGVRLDAAVLNAAVGTASPVTAGHGIEVTALGVPHGNVPTVAYRVRVDGRTIVFAADQNGTDDGFADFASGADLLVMHAGLSQDAPDPLARLHARPATVGRLAQRANAQRLLLSHLMAAPPMVRTPEWFTLPDTDGAVAAVREQFAGPVVVAEDLACVPVPPKP